MPTPPLPLSQDSEPSGFNPDAFAPLRLCVRRGSDAAISLRVPTDLQVVEEVVDVIARHCLASGLGARAARFNLRVALSEALSNAIVYGNCLDPAKSVDVRVQVDGAGIAVHVCDEGDGFDPGSIPNPTGPDRLERSDGRGLFLIRQLVDDVSFNDRGNSICMILRRA